MRIERESNGEEMDQSVRDIIDSYGEPNPMLSAREWIYGAYDFINAVLSGHYDKIGMGLDIIDGIMCVTKNPDDVYSKAPDLVRGINAGGSS